MELKPGTGENQKIETVFVQIIQANYECYTKREVLKAKEAQCMQALIGSPSKGDYKGLVSSKMITKCPITTDDITNTREIFGPDLARRAGKISPSHPCTSGGRLRGSTLLSGGEKQNSDVDG